MRKVVALPLALAATLSAAVALAAAPLSAAKAIDPKAYDTSSLGRIQYHRPADKDSLEFSDNGVTIRRYVLNPDTLTLSLILHLDSNRKAQNTRTRFCGKTFPASAVDDQTEYRDNLKHGLYRRWDCNTGELIDSMYFQNGELHGDKITFLNGKLQYRFPYIRGREHGYLLTYYPSGNIAAYQLCHGGTCFKSYKMPDKQSDSMDSLARFVIEPHF